MVARIGVLPAVGTVGTVGAVVTVLAAAVVAVAPSSARAAAVECSYAPVLAKQIVVNKPTINFRTPVSIKGTDCTHVFTASESLEHRGDTYFLNWTQDSHTASDAVYATTVKPGTYRTTSPSCGVTGSDGSSRTCSVGAGSTIIKFGGKAHLSATRLAGKNSDKVRFTTHATRYQPDATKYVTTTVSIQQYYSGAWHTVHSATATGSHGYVWTRTDAKVGTYRAVSASTSTAFGGASTTVKQ